MSRSGDKLPLSVAEFRNLPEGLESDFVIPEVPQKRKVTDLKYTIVLAICLGLLAIFLLYCGSQSHLKRLTHGYDNCGNVCGERNPVVAGLECSGEDDTNKPFLKYDKGNYDDEHLKVVGCVEKCGDGYFEVFNRCFPGKASDDAKVYFSEIANDLRVGSGYLVALILIGLGACFGMLALFRYCPAFIVWIILIGSLSGFVILTCYLWYLTGVVDEQTAQQVKIFAIFLTIVTLILLALLVFLYKKIKLIIRLFKEAMRAVFGVPLILFEPLLSFVANGILLFCFFYFVLTLETAGELQVGYGNYAYMPTNFIIFTRFFNFVIALWMVQFIVGCQHMVVSGAISAYYFARDRTSVASPIYNSFYNLIRYHLGTVAIGSLVVTLITLLRALIRSLTNNRSIQLLIDCCLRPIEDFLRYLTKNAYIQTAMHGQSFFKSGKRAARLLVANALSAIAINSIGDFILFMAKLLIALFTVFVGIAMLINTEIKHFYIIVIIGFLVTAILADCFFTVFETAIDTLFLCFCEDMAMNDGVSQSYYMSTDLMQFIEDAKKIYKKK